MLTAHLLVVAVALTAADEPVPVAMVLAEQGGATVTSPDGKTKPVRVMDILKSGDKLVADGNVRLVILKDGHKERISGAVTLSEAGSEPKAQVTLEPGKLSSAHLEGLNRLARSSRGGVVVPRGVPGGITSEAMKQEAVLSERPTFAWAEVDSPSGFYLRVYEEADNSENAHLLWQRITLGESEIEYPEDEEPLRVGKKYVWLVANGPEDNRATQIFHKSAFRIARKEEKAAAEELLGSAGQGTPEEQLMSAVALHEMSFYTPAREVFEKLVKECPEEPSYRWALAEYLEWSGDAKRAEEEKAKAAKLEEKK